MTRRRPAVDLATSVGSVRLAGPVMTASGTAGHGAELGRYFDLSSIGAVVVKSLSAEPWAGNPAPRVHETAGGMLNSVGLQNPGVDAWLAHELPALEAAGAAVVVSIWGFTPEAFEKAAVAVAAASPAVVAVEVNLSCPNTERRAFAHHATTAAEAFAATGGCGRPRWAKLSADVADITEVAEAVVEAGADALTLVNTLRGFAIDPRTRRPRLGGAGGGLSGPAIHPVAVRAVSECHRRLPDVPIVGVGGVAGADDAAELLLAGASAVQVGTATFRDPRAPARIQAALARWCADEGLTSVRELIGAAVT